MPLPLQPDAFLGHSEQIGDGGGVQHFRVGQQCPGAGRPRGLVLRDRRRDGAPVARSYGLCVFRGEDDSGTADTRPLSRGRVLTGPPERLWRQPPQVAITTATEWGSVIIAQAGGRDTPRVSSAPLLIYPSLILSCRPISR
jgi:hypothetical protein